MIKYPCLVFNMEKIRHNATTIQRFCWVKEIKIGGISKGFNAIPQIVQVMIDSGFQA
jgi:predicted amino acid racemase